MEKPEEIQQGLELLRKLLEQAGSGKDVPAAATTAAHPLPPALQDFVRQMALLHGIDPTSGEVLPASDTKH